MKNRKALYNLFSLLNCLIPKTNTIVIYGGSYLDDNSEAMFRYLLEETNYRIICLADSKMNYLIRKNVKLKRCSYFNALLAMMTSKVAIDSSYHTIKMKPTKKQIFIQCWHGSPLKYMHPSDGINNSIYYSKLYYAAEIFKNHMQTYFGAADDQMFCGGSPRNDYLFSEIPLPELFQFSGKSVIWMPTFRHGIGRSESDIDIPVINKDNVGELNQRLEQLNVRLYIKAHRLQMNGFQNLVNDKHSNIVLLSDADLKNNNIPLYAFLSKMDALLTDYSSVYFDYLLLDKPIGFVIDDFEQYKKNRGFAFDEPYDLMPGEKIYSIDELLAFFDGLASGIDKFSPDRHRVNSICNTFTDAGNCKRCADIMKDYLE